MNLRFRPTRLWVETDPLLLDRMIANLVSNALRYTHPGGRVLVVARQRGNEVLIEVRDNGIGIAQSDQAAIFAEFYQVGNTAREHNKGLGLGLSIVDRLAKALDIKVSLRSRLREGTVFGLRLTGSPPRVQARPAESGAAQGGKVHCVGASPEMQECIRLLEGWGYTVSTESNAGNKALPDNAVLIAEPTLANAVSHALAPGAPLIVLLTGGAAALPAGAHALPAPIRPAKLRALLNQLQKTLSKSMP